MAGNRVAGEPSGAVPSRTDVPADSLVFAVPVGLLGRCPVRLG